MASTASRAALCRLRQDIARIEGRLAEAVVLDAPASPEPSDGASLDRLILSGRTEAAQLAAGLRPRTRRGRVGLGAASLDAALAGGLPLATLHDIRTRRSADGAAAAGFVLAVLSRLAEAGVARSVLWISSAAARRETGRLHPPGLAALGFRPDGVVEASARTAEEALWAFEAALGCAGLGAAVCEIWGSRIDLTASRRCALRARDAGVTGLFLRPGGKAEPSAAEFRLAVAPARAGPVRVEGSALDRAVGCTAWTVALERSRDGRTGEFTVEWNAHGRIFAERGRDGRIDRFRNDGPAHPQHRPAASADRPPSPAGETGPAGENGKRVAGWRHAS